MEDEEYARELFAILTAPPGEPVDAYGTGVDRIDRYDGYGTEVRVTSLDVVPGEHGEQIAVGFHLEVPLGVDVPPEGTVHLPFAAEWREAQGFVTPALHAPFVARDVMRGVREHVSRRHDERSREPDLPGRTEQGAMLISLLARHGKVTQVAEGHIVVSQGSREPWLTVVLSPDEWERVLQRNGVPHPEDIDDYEELLAAWHQDGDFLVAWEDELARSARAELPPVDGNIRSIVRMQAARDRGEDPPAVKGWFAYAPVEDDELPG